MDTTSPSYGIGTSIARIFGTLKVLKAIRKGPEIKIGNNVRIAPVGNATNHPIGKFPHYHRRVVGPNGQTKPGGGIGRHRPWETKSTDTCFKDRF